MAINFPDSPSVDQEHTVGNTTWKWDGTVWNALGSVGSQITVANEATDASCFPLFSTDATGAIQPKTNAGLTFDSSAQTLHSNNFTTDDATIGICGVTDYVLLGDNDELRVGAGNDARLYFDGVDDVFLDMNNGIDFRLRGGAANDSMIVALEDGAVTLYWDGTSCVSTQWFATTGVTSSLHLKDHEGNQHDVGFNNLRKKNDNASDTLEAAHCGNVAFTDNSTAYTLTLEASGSLDFPVNGMTTVINAFTSANYTITEGATTTLYYLDGTTRVDTAGGCTLGPGGVANIWREAAGVYYIWGTGITA